MIDNIDIDTLRTIMVDHFNYSVSKAKTYDYWLAMGVIMHELEWSGDHSSYTWDIFMTDLQKLIGDDELPAKKCKRVPAPASALVSPIYTGSRARLQPALVSPIYTGSRARLHPALALSKRYYYPRLSSPKLTSEESELLAKKAKAIDASVDFIADKFSLIDCDDIVPAKKAKRVEAPVPAPVPVPLTQADGELPAKKSKLNTQTSIM